jgi:hypothetical protein|tara:strand:+ start:302 stop:700 length:399 start_codon:yes stop_codon:yes gene_type:complete
MNETTEYKLIKLVNGEDIICMVESDDSKNYKILWPLKLQVMPKVTKKGILESLNLSTWIQSYTEERVFDLPVRSVVMTIEPSPGLSRYYEYVVRKLMREENEEYSDWSDEINEDDIYDELLEEEESPSKLIH